MPASSCYLFKNCLEYVSMDRITEHVPAFVRGIYILYRSENRGKTMNVVNNGMARGQKSGVGGRLLSHQKNKKKAGLWTHFSVYEVWDNVTSSQVEELEGLLRHVYARDINANALNVQKRSKIIGRIRRRKLDNWLFTTVGERPTL